MKKIFHILILTIISAQNTLQASQPAKSILGKRKDIQDTTQLDERPVKLQKRIDTQLDNQLIDAVKTYNIPATARLLREGANPDIRDENGYTILGYAVGNIPILSLLLNHQADVNIKDNTGSELAPLQIAIGANIDERPYLDAITLLLDKSADINLSSNSGFTPLQSATFFNAEDIALQIIDMFFDAPQTLDINAQDKRGNTALIIAATKGYARIAHLLLEKGADWKLTNKRGKTAEGFARHYGKNEVVTTIENFKELQASGHREALRSVAEKVLRSQWHTPGPKPASGGLKGKAQNISISVASFLRPKTQQATRPAEVNVEEQKQEADIQNLGE